MVFKTACKKLVGRGHEQNKIPCQDSVADCITDSTACIVLCDGAGSYAQSHVASQAISEAICHEICNNFDFWYSKDDTDLQSSLIQLGRNSVGEGIEPACTLILFAKNEDGRTLLIHLGDGVALGSDCEKENTVLSEPENGEEKYITYFFNSYDAEEHVRIQRFIPDVYNAVILCSDGSAVSLVANDMSFVAPATGNIAKTVKCLPKEDVEECLKADMASFMRPNTTDDVSLATLYFREKNEENA